MSCNRSRKKLSEIAELKVPLTEVQEDFLKKLRDIRTLGTESHTRYRGAKRAAQEAAYQGSLA